MWTSDLGFGIKRLLQCHPHPFSALLPALFPLFCPPLLPTPLLLPSSAHTLALASNDCCRATSDFSCQPMKRSAT